MENNCLSFFFFNDTIFIFFEIFFKYSPFLFIKTKVTECPLLIQSVAKLIHTFSAPPALKSGKIKSYFHFFKIIKFVFLYKFEFNSFFIKFKFNIFFSKKINPKNHPMILFPIKIYQSNRK